MSDPPAWSLETLTKDAAEAREIFRAERLDEPLELYSRFFDTFTPIFDRLIGRLPELAAPDTDSDLIADLLSDADTRTALRYLAAPPVSEDDLKTLANARLSGTSLRQDPTQGHRIREIILQVLDPHRFPWVKDGRNPSQREQEIAITASAVLVAVKKVETKRRNDAKNNQEDRVKQLLRDAGFDEVRKRDMPLLKDAPEPGQYCGESKLGHTKADLVVGLYDRRIMPIECKVSNSEVNSFKRVNHEASNKARAWLDEFGRNGTVPAAVLGGVFRPANLEAAQSVGLSLFWAHRLGDLVDFINATRS